MKKSDANTVIKFSKFFIFVQPQAKLSSVQKQSERAIIGSDHIIIRQPWTVNKSHMGSQHGAC